MTAELTVSDEVVIGFFTAVIVGLVAAVGVLWNYIIKKKPPK